MAALASATALPTASAATGKAGAGLASDGRSLDALRNAAARDPRAAAREAAKQFESLFTAELLKSMRAASEGGLMDNEASKLGTQMLDAQLSTQLAGRPGGLADVIARQLERQMGIAPGPIPSAASGNAALPAVVTPANAPRVPSTSAAAFVSRHSDSAKAAEAKTGIPASFMLAQAAHETGWGQRQIKGADGSASNNLFGIKAGAQWKGPTVDATTTEVVGGVARKVVQRFRAYASEAESFADYAQMMKNSPRYAAAVAGAQAHGGDATAFAQGLQDAGYATDPAYAAKLGRVIQTTQRLQRSAVQG